MIDLPDVLGHLSYMGILGGTLLLAKKNKYGWMCRSIGDIGWTCVGLMTGMSSLIIWGVIFCLNDLRGFLIWKWKEDEDCISQSKRPEPSKRSSENNPRSDESTGRRCSEPSDGEPRGGFVALPGSPFEIAPLYRVQEYKELPKPRSPKIGRAHV